MGFEKIIADTCIWIEYLKGKSAVSGELKSLIENEKAVITGPVIYELLQGAKSKKDATLIKEIGRSLPVLEVTHEIWLLAGDIFFDLRRNGVTLPPSDVLLAAVAIKNNGSLFTIDSHFDHIQILERYYPKNF